MIRHALRWGVLCLKNSGVDTPKLDAEVLLMHALNIDRNKLYLFSDTILNLKEKERYRECIERRSKREPVAYITGHKEFRSLDFKLTKAVLVPRPETEILVDETLEEYGKKKDNRSVTRILELGTGSGIVAVSLAKEIEHISLVATDISLEIIQVAQKNAQLHNVDDKISFFVGDFLNAIKHKRNRFDVIVSNPPYLSKSDWERAQPEIREHEPPDSLFGGDDGMDFYRTIIPEASSLLCKDGCLILEVGIGQADMVSDMIKQSASYSKVEVIKDLSQTKRVVKATK
jgi:release factor glutamine methyltransferase